MESELWKRGGMLIVTACGLVLEDTPAQSVVSAGETVKPFANI